jgi:hypothetical protein
MKTTLTQDCRGYADEAGTIRYRIENSITYVLPGDLPFPEIFLFQVGSAGDPKSDTFLRIAVLTDLTGAARGRDPALSQERPTYLAATFAIEYADLATAVQARSIIQARVDDLVDNWRTYQEEFLAGPTVALPLATSSVVAAAKEALRTALSVRDSRSSDLTKVSATLTVATATASSAATTLARATTLSNAFSDLYNRTLTLYTGDQNYRAEAEALLSACQAFSAVVHAASGQDTAGLTGALAAFDAAITAMQNAGASDTRTVRPFLQDLESRVANEYAARAGELSAARTAKETADASAAAATTKVSLAEAALADAQAATDAALVTVKNYCPNFDPAKDL